jgi:TolA-binding protein
MRAHAFGFVVPFAIVMAMTGGCALSNPYAARGQASPTPSQSDNDGWLYRSLTGQKDKSAENAPPGPNAPGVGGEPIRQASATVNLDDDPLTPAKYRTLPPSGASSSTAAAPGGLPGTPVTAESLVASRKKTPKNEDDEPSGLDALAPSNVWKGMKAMAGYGPNEDIARQAYSEGVELFNQRKYDAAAAKFATAADRWPDSALEEDAFFMLGESHFFADRYPKAHEAYEQLLKRYEYSRYLDRSVAREFAIGRFWEQYDRAEPHWPLTANFTDKTRPWFDTWGHGLKCYEHVRLNDPTGPLADDALMAAGNANFLAHRYEEASFNYDTLRKEYPKSEHQLKAHLLAIEAKQHVYQGPLYDATALKEAGEVADSALLRFGTQLGDEKARVIDAKNKVVEQRAERDWMVGQFYERKKQFGAARIYYNSVVQDYPQTQVAAAARQRLEEIKEFPAEPVNHFEWFTQYFETNKKRR